MTPEEFAARRRSLSDQIIAALQRLFASLGSWRDADRAVFVEQAVPLLRGAQSALGALTTAWVAHRAAEALGRPLAVPGVDPAGLVDLRAGVSDVEVYARPFKTVYLALSQGQDLPAAVQSGAVRLAEIAEFDLQQTYAAASATALAGLPERARPRYWRRVLVGPENCALCVVASTQRYKVETLNPIHPGCNCAVDPLYGADPGQVLDAALLERAHAAAAELTGESDRGGRAPDYRKVATTITAEHGEIGTVLVAPREKFTGPRQLAA